VKQPATTGSAKHAASSSTKSKHAAAGTTKHAASASTDTKTAKAGKKKTTTAKKHASTAPAKKKTTATAPAKKTATTKKTAAKTTTWSPYFTVACCQAAALADLLRLSGGACSDEDMLGLYFGVTPDPDAGASILAALEAASAFGLAGARPVFAPAAFNPARTQVVGMHLAEHHALVRHGGEWLTWGKRWPCSAFTGPIDEAWEVQWVSQ
jgi:hypothetical protein